jgi:K+-transporting ATPase KdpF subunit
MNSGEPETMQDALFVAITIVFFVISIGYIRFCERVK